MKKLLPLLCFIMVAKSHAGELTHQFNNPSFSGVGYSSHVLTIEQLQTQRRQKVKDDQKAIEEKAVRDANSTNLAKFLNNFEARVYAELSKRMADELFSESGATSGQLDFMGTSISWAKIGTDVNLVIINPNGGKTEITVPIGSFAI